MQRTSCSRASGIVDANADRDPVIVLRLIVAGARDGLGGGGTELPSCQGIVDHLIGRGWRTESGNKQACRERGTVSRTHGGLLVRLAYTKTRLAAKIIRSGHWHAEMRARSHITPP